MPNGLVRERGARIGLLMVLVKLPSLSSLVQRRPPVRLKSSVMLTVSCPKSAMLVRSWLNWVSTALVLGPAAHVALARPPKVGADVGAAANSAAPVPAGSPNPASNTGPLAIAPVMIAPAIVGANGAAAPNNGAIAAANTGIAAAAYRAWTRFPTVGAQK